MKKILIALAALVLALIACTYIFIPSTITVSSAIVFSAPLNGVYRCISNNDMWQHWQPAGNAVKAKVTRANAATKTAEVFLFKGEDSVSSIMNLLNVTNDSIAMHWQLSIDAGSNPFARIGNYNKAVAYKKGMDNMLNEIKNFTGKDENIYGLHVYEAGTKDTFIITTKVNLSHYPSVTDIYDLINSLKKYSAQFDAQPTNHPMYNVTKINEDSMRLMVGLPLNKAVPQSNIVTLVKMVSGRFLVTEVKGGETAVQHALTQLQFYFPEHHRTSMAIPFTYLITDRIAEPDTSKWVSKIYSPVY